MSGIIVRGSLVHYETFGRGKPLVLIHGWLGSWRYWVPVMDDLSADYRTYALDLWGFGDSSKDTVSYTVDAYVDQVLAFMDELGVWQVPLVGHTLGAAIAVRMAERHPDRVTRILGAGLPLLPSGINRRVLATGSNEALAKLFWGRQRPYSEVDMSLSKMAPMALAETIQAVASLNLRELVEEVEVPLLGVYGSKDSVIEPDQADELEASHASARAIVLSAARHFPMLDQIAKFSRLLRDFMDVETPEDLSELTIKKEWRRRTR